MSELTLRVTKMENILDDLTEIVEKSYETMNDLKSNLDKLKTKYYNMLGDYTFIQNPEFADMASELQKGIQGDIKKTIPNILNDLEVAFRNCISDEEPQKGMKK